MNTTMTFFQQKYTCKSIICEDFINIGYNRCIYDPKGCLHGAGNVICLFEWELTCLKTCDVMLAFEFILHSERCMQPGLSTSIKIC